MIVGEAATTSWRGKRYFDGLPACSSSTPATGAGSLRPRPNRPRNSLLSDLVVRASGGDRTGRPARLLCSRRSHPCLLLDRRRRSCRDRVQAREVLLEVQVRPTKHKVISRAVAYHGTPQGALAITGIPAMKELFERYAGGFRVPNTNYYRAEEIGATDRGVRPLGGHSLDREDHRVRGPETVAAIFLEPVQNSGGCFPPPPGYFKRVREICDQYDVLLVADEVIRASVASATLRVTLRFPAGHDHLREGHDQRILADRRDHHQRDRYTSFKHGTTAFYHGYTFGGHPVSAAVAIDNLDISRRRNWSRTFDENSSLHARAAEGPADRRRCTR